MVPPTSADRDQHAAQRLASGGARGAALVGIEGPLAEVAAVLDRARAGDGGATLIVNEPGSGKSALANAAAALVASEFLVLRARGMESEMELPYSGLHELLLPVLRDVPLLPQRAQDTLLAALRMRDRGDVQPVDVAMAVLTLVAALSESRPVLLIIDDLHWIDAATIAVLAFVSRRIRHDRVALLAASRPSEVCERLEATTIELAPLTAAAASELVQRILGQPIAPKAAEALIAATGGNPLAIIETARVLGTDLLRLGSTLDEPVPPSELIRRGFAAQLSGLQPTTRAALSIVAASLDGSADVLRDALAQLGLPFEALDDAEAAGILDNELGRLSFSHPLLRSFVYHDDAAAVRRQSHTALAAVARDRGSRAWHAATASTVPDEAVAAELDAAADEFRARGGYLAAARALERAARLTPDEGERARRLFESGDAAMRAGHTPWSTELLEEAKGSATDPALAMWIERLLLVQAAQRAAPFEVHPRLMQLGRDAAEFDPNLTAQALSTAALDATVWGRMDDSREAIAALAEFGGWTDQGAVAEVLGARGLILTMSGDDPVEGGRLLREAGEHFFGSDSGSDLWIGEPLIWIEEYALAEQLMAHFIAIGQATGNSILMHTGRWTEALLHTRTGQWAAAEIGYQQAAHLSATTGLAWNSAMDDASLAILLGSRGDEAARALIAATEPVALTNGYGILESYFGTALGLLELAHGNAEQAIRQFERASTWCAQAEQREPGILSWPADLPEAYFAAGQREQAILATETLRERAEATGRVWALGAVARLDGLLSDGDDYAAAFERSVELFNQLPAPFEAARTRLHHGRRLRRSGLRNRARAELHAALDVFERLGATPWAAQVRTELQASGESNLSAQDGPDAPLLTSQEVCVADCVAQGMTNKQVAAQLFLTPKTIEWHLRNVYRKLGIRTRVQLAQWVTARGGDATG